MGRRKADEKAIPLGELLDTRFSITDEQASNCIGKRILEARLKKGVTQKAMVDALEKIGCKLNVNSYGRWERGDTYPSAYQLVAVCRLLGIDEEISFFSTTPKAQRLNELGRKKVMEYREDLIATGRYAPKPVIDIEEIRSRKMKKYTAPVSAGSGNFLEDGDYEMVDFPETAIPDGADFALTISGDSMEPVYQDGQIIWVQETSELREGEEGIFIYDGQAYFKVLAERIVDEDGKNEHIPVLLSYNKKYKPREVKLSLGFDVVGRVL